MKSQLIKNEEARYKASSFKKTDKRKKAPFTLKVDNDVFNLKVNFGGGLNIYRKNLTESVKEQRFKIREKYKGIQNDEIRNRLVSTEYSELSEKSFVESEKTLATKVRQPKKLASARQRKIENSQEKNARDCISFSRAIMTNLWESYVRTEKKEITFRLFESKMKQTKFKNTILERYQ